MKVCKVGIDNAVKMAKWEQTLIKIKCISKLVFYNKNDVREQNKQYCKKKTIYRREFIYIEKFLDGSTLLKLTEGILLWKEFVQTMFFSNNPGLTV